jgi:hypothetical protein
MPRTPTIFVYAVPPEHATSNHHTVLEVAFHPSMTACAMGPAEYRMCNTQRQNIEVLRALIRERGNDGLPRWRTIELDHAVDFGYEECCSWVQNMIDSTIVELLTAS